MRKRTHSFLFVGSQPCLDFINTQMIVKGQPTDALESFEHLIAWFIQAKLMTQLQAKSVRVSLGSDEMTSLLEQAKTFRTVLRDMVERITVSRPIPDTTIYAINRYLSQRPSYAQIVQNKEGRFEQHLRSAATAAQDILALLAEAASDLLCHTDITMIKKCGNPACILYFYDTTKNHTRSWCSMRFCGNRMKAAAHYRRTRSTFGNHTAAKT